MFIIGVIVKVPNRARRWSRRCRFDRFDNRFKRFDRLNGRGLGERGGRRLLKFDWCKGCCRLDHRRRDDDRFVVVLRLQAGCLLAGRPLQVFFALLREKCRVAAVGWIIFASVAEQPRQHAAGLR